jgi:hypothetical protein
LGAFKDLAIMAMENPDAYPEIVQQLKASGLYHINSVEDPGEYEMFVGKFRGQRLRSIPTEYLQWVVDRFTDHRRLVEKCHQELEQRYSCSESFSYDPSCKI